LRIANFFALGEDKSNFEGNPAREKGEKGKGF
jgi:hypothetical protein